ncbi:hypothetical protein SAMN05428969_2809 [Devosia sp. YR412]|uniref:hypothetical protein n=1 Tax=Devosia sp. YR412 TaxID=1881030 RepID=UPI0008CF4B4F|nr:hypothetical protein [Devosia sp. YR412]SEQ37509.1 hypothetical protein SAMN05428969_2809 [Devosia sp. YR412]
MRQSGSKGSGNLAFPLRLDRLGWSAVLFVLQSLTAFTWAEEPYAPLTRWDEPSGGQLNISVFVFRDANRDGIYDLGDRPMSGIIVDATGLGPASSTESNSAGFANFKMSGSNVNADILFAGRYQFSTLVPPHWQLTTGNVEQFTEFEMMPGSPADIVAKPPLSPVGLAPDLSISGPLPALGDGEALELTMQGGQTIEIAGDDGHFSAPVEPGSWRFTSGDAGTAVEVKAIPVLLGDTWWEEPVIEAAADTLVTFDDLQSEGVLKVPSGYSGLNWDNFVMTQQKFYEPAGYRNGAMSGEFLAYNGSGHPAAISRKVPFDFVGGAFGISTFQAEGETLTITGWRGEEQVYQQKVTLSALGPVYLAAEMRDVTRLDFATARYWQFTADDLEFRMGAP